MTNNAFRLHIHRTRRLVAVTASVAALAGFGAVAMSSGGAAGAASTPECSSIAGTPTATTTHAPAAQLASLRTGTSGC